MPPICWGEQPGAFLLVVIPCLRKGCWRRCFSPSFLLGEFVFANMLVGTRYETLQVYLYNMRATWATSPAPW